jgi:aminobenzoyl-glutamate transport protein
MAASTFFIAGAGTWATEKVIIPRLGTYEGEETADAIDSLSSAEKRGLWFALVATVLSTAMLLWGTVPSDGILRNAETGDLLNSPFLKGIVAFIFLLGLVLGGAYGWGAGTIKNDTQLMESMGKAIQGLGIYMVLVFFAAQFVAYFNWSQLGLIVAVEGAELLKASGLGSIPLMIAFVIVAGVVNMFMGSASAKWAVMAPVFVPMFMLLGYTPELTQTAYRIGDSVTNIISPMMSYFALIVAFVARYQKNAGIGTVIALMLPYTVVFFLVWTVILIVWVALDLPVGPGAKMYLPS